MKIMILIVIDISISNFDIREPKNGERDPCGLLRVFLVVHFCHIGFWYFGILRLKNPHLFNKLSKLFRDIKFWSVQTQNSVETLFLSERANLQLFRTPKIFDIDALFVMLEGFLC